MERLNQIQRPRIGLYSVGHADYWRQFDGLLNRLNLYNQFIGERISQSADVINAGMIDSDTKAREAVELFSRNQVDLIFCHVATYAMSASHLAIPRDCQRPVVILNLQPTAAMNYSKTTTGEWLAHCVGCSIPEIANAMNRFGIEFHLVSGLLGLTQTPESSVADEATSDHPEAIRAWNEIEEWISAAKVKKQLRNGRMGFLGHTYPGMLDMYSDFTMIEAQAGLHVEILEMCDVLKLSRDVTEKQELDKLRQVEEMFIISEDSPTDPLVRKPDGDQLRFSCRVAVALEKLVKEFELDALTYFYRGRENNDYQRLQESSTLGYSLLTAQGIPCSGEGDMKTAIAMKVSDTLGVGGSFSEIVACDYYLNTIILGHDGPFHIEISAGKPILRGMQLYHGKTGQGISVEAAVRQGPVTLLNITQTHDGRMRAIVNQGEAVTGPLLQIGNTMTHIRFTKNPTEMMNAWFSLAPTHHCALSVGYNLTVLEKVAIFMSWPCTSLSHENRV